MTANAFTRASRATRIIGGAAGAVTLGGAIAIFGSAAAFAAPGETCADTTAGGAPAATLIADGICQVTITADGTYTFPASIAKLTAVVVGAGGGAQYYINGYGHGNGGGGGEVVYVDHAAVGAPLDVTIGLGGPVAGTTDATGSIGGDTSFDTTVAHGGSAGTAAASGGGNPGSVAISGGGTSDSGTGGGAAGAATNNFTAGPGYLLSEIPGVDPALWPSTADDAISYGMGGGNAPSTAPVDPDLSSGQGGAMSLGTPPNAVPGADGVVILRFAATEPAAVTPPPATPAPDTAAPTDPPALASTGTPSADPALAILGAAGVGLGGAIALFVARRRAAARHQR